MWIEAKIFPLAQQKVYLRFLPISLNFGLKFLYIGILLMVYYVLKGKGNYVEIDIFRGRKIFISVFGKVNWCSLNYKIFKEKCKSKAVI